MFKKIKIKLYNLLRRSEKYTGIDNVYYFKSGFWLALSRIVSIIKGLVIAILMANLLPKETFGQYKYIISIFSLVYIFALPGMGNAIIQSLARNKDGIFQVARNQILKFSSLGSLTLLIISAYYYQTGNNIFSLIFVMLSILFPLFSISSYYTSILNGKKKFDKYTRYFTTYSLFTSLAIITAIVFSGYIFWLIFAYVLSDIIIGLFLTRRAEGLLKNKDFEKDSITYGKKLSLVSIIEIVASQIDKILFPIFLGFEELAIYSIALAAPEQAKSFLRSISSNLLPRFSSNTHNEELKKKIKSYFFKSMIPLSVIIIIYIILAPLLFHLFFPKYTEAIRYSQIFSISLITFPTILFYTYFNSRKKSREIFKINLNFSVIKILALIILLPTLGIYGAIYSIMIARLASIIYSYYIFNKTTTS